MVHIPHLGLIKKLSFALLLAVSLCSILYPMVSSASAAPVRKVAVPASLPSNSNSSCPPTLQVGSTGTWVQALQFALNAEYYGGKLTQYSHFNPPLATDGGFGPYTQTAVIDYQLTVNSDYNVGLNTDGVVSARTWNWLGFCAINGWAPNTPFVNDSSNNKTCPPTLQQGSSGAWVQVLQSLLDSLDAGNDFIPSTGFGPLLAIDGGFGPATKAAVVFFQNQWQLHPDGIVGPQTWSQLGMCY